jgi:hypothetical protein
MNLEFSPAKMLTEIITTGHIGARRMGNTGITENHNLLEKDGKRPLQDPEPGQTRTKLS